MAEMLETQSALLSEAAHGELLNQCEDQFAVLEKLLNEIILSEPDSCEQPQDQSVNRLMATAAEQKKWETLEPNLLAVHSDILLQAGKEEMFKLCSQLEMIVLCYEAKRDKLKETKELEKKWLEEKTQMLEAVTDHIERLRIENEKLSVQSIFTDTRDKIYKMKLCQESLMESLGEILDKHVPLPQIDSKKIKKSNQDDAEEFISLSEILELLMNQVLNAPHDPYIEVDATFWPPYIEMLLRYGIAIRHQENNLKIRLEPFC